MAKFLQTTLDEMALQSKGESHSERAKEFAEFFEKVNKLNCYFLVSIITRHDNLFGLN